MNFKITPAPPDGIRIKTEFYVDTWGELRDMMEYLQNAETEVI